EEVGRIGRQKDPPRPSTRLSDLGRSGPHNPLRAGESGAPSVPTGERSSLASIAAQRHTEPAKLPKLLRGELDWIVMKALEKDRARRYETAGGLARDIRRHLDGEAGEAGPPAPRDRLREPARRHPAGPASAPALPAPPG